MARVTRIERPTDRRSGTNGYDPEQDETRAPLLSPDAHTAARPTQRSARDDAWRIFGAIAACFAITLLLNTKSFVKVAEDRPDGPARSVLLTTARGLDAAAGAVRLDRVNAWIDAALNRQDEAPRFAPVPAATPAPDDGRPVAVSPTDATAATATPDPNATGAADSASSSRSAPAAPPPTPAPAAAPRAVSTSNQLRVYVAGDSFVEWLGYDLADYGKRDGYLTTRLDFKISAGLARPDYFDWPARIGQAMTGDPPPEAVVFFVGANDYTDMRGDTGSLTRGTPEWVAEYGRRAANVMEIVGRRGAQLYWVGQPIMRDKARSKTAADINAVVAAEASKRPWVHYIDTWSLFTDASGNYAPVLPDASGEPVRVRQDEGIHLTRAGTAWVSDIVYKAIRRDWKIQ